MGRTIRILTPAETIVPVSALDEALTAAGLRADLVETPHPRATDAPSRGIKFPISERNRNEMPTRGRQGVVTC